MKIKRYKQFLESKSDNMWDIIPQSVKDLQLLFKSKGKKLYVVGGAVRDFLTGDKPKDFDLATDALPDEVLEVIGKDYKTNLQGKALELLLYSPMINQKEWKLQHSEKMSVKEEILKLN